MTHTLTVELSSEVYETLTAQAQESQQTVEETAASLLSKGVEKPSQNGHEGELPEELKPLREIGFSNQQILSLITGAPVDVEWTEEEFAFVNLLLDQLIASIDRVSHKIRLTTEAFDEKRERAEAA